jgi:hypothetical protein
MVSLHKIKHNKMKLKFIVIIFLFTALGFSQTKGIIKGVVTDKDMNNEILPFANVIVKGQNIAVNTNENGNYSIEIAPGEYILEFSFLGYENTTEKVIVKENETTVINKSIGTGSFSLQEVSVKSVVNREKETALLLDQKKSIEVKQEIGAQELSRKGIGDVASAVAKTTGVSKQEGSNSVYVRGLGDRYNSTSINGLPVPSNDPEKKNIALDLFSTDIVEFISIDKVYSSRISGDFAGGNVNISSKNYKGNGLFEIAIGSAINTNAVAKNGEFYLQDGPNLLGFSSDKIPNNPLSGYNFQNKLAPVKESPFGGNLSFKAGKSFDIGKEGKLNLFANGSFSNGFEYKEGLNQSINAQAVKLKSFQQERFGYKTNTTGMFNANYKINSNHKLSYNFLIVNSSEQFKDNYIGYNRDFEDSDILVQRATFTKNTLFVNQLLGNHELTNKIDFDWGLSYSKIKGNMPDRTQNTMKFNEDLNGYTFGQNTITDNHRYYQNLTEDEIAANIAVNYQLGNKENANYKGKITLGYNGRIKNRDFKAIQFNFRFYDNLLNTVVNPNNLDSVLNQENYSNGLFNIEAFGGLRPQTYTGEQNIHSGFASLEYRLTNKLSSIVGLRFEKVEQTVSWKTQLGADTNSFNRNEILPNIILKYEVNEKQNLRFGASKTYTLPQFKERALFIYEDVTEVKVGNPYLYPSQNYNADLKWEYFLKNDELFSVTAFGKYIVDPINEITLASSTNDISFINTGDFGTVYGVELEIRKNIFEIESDLTNKLSFGFNASYMKTDQELNSEKVRNETDYNINLTNKKAGFTGASDFLLNADLSYTKDLQNDKNITATLIYSHYSDRLYALGIEQKGNLVDKGMGSLDIVLKTKMNKNLGFNLNTRNLLNPNFKRVQENASGDVPVLVYKKGVFLSLGLDYRF